MKRSTFNAIAASLAFGAVTRPLDGMAQSESEDTKKSLQAQSERARVVAERGRKRHYTKEFDLSGLPHYNPTKLYTGWLRIHGSNYLSDGALGEYWQQGFAKFQPGIHLSFYNPTSASAFAALYYDQADIVMDHAPLFYDLLAYQRIKDANPVQITAVTGSYDVAGWQNSIAVLVNEQNPLKGITLKQLDGIYGAERDGGWGGTNFHPEWARGAEGNIRTWDALGVGGKWSGKRITPYGFAIRYSTATEFSDRILRGSDKWNEDLRGFAHIVRPDGTRYIEADHIDDALAADPFGIAYNRYRGERPKVRRLPVAASEGGPFVEHTLENCQNRTYPLFSEAFFFTNPKKIARTNPLVREFLSYVLSQEGQNEVQRDGKYLPLTASVVHENLPQLDLV